MNQREGLHSPPEVKEAAEDRSVPLFLAPSKSVETTFSALVQMWSDGVARTVLHKAIPT